MLLREAEKKDIPELADLMGELGYPTETKAMEERFAKIAVHPDYHTIVAEKDAELVGMIGMFRGLSYEKDEPSIRIIALVVKEEVRNQKIGQQLLEQAEEWASRQGVRKLAVNTGKRRVESHLFYKNRGFEETGAGFYKSLEK
ncbi:GNAT family N-acetyltransferase [Fictibacillus sp. KIGAM418]|uniref:GNAT family N-acetyltransferase n=1 Tax=Fictibacillus marinisediminis TaxID=2878389 RepID=A0A9X1XA72_9BACL|nr:GNAT family N-acetyltransferase [Fictibacillus marinisediminis]MCK6256441.1 GNAT family N-acetyltransferase [Fictibacillus marinisediminis]